MANSEKAPSEATAPAQHGLRKKQSGSADSTPSHSRAAPPADASKVKSASLWDKLPPWVSSNLRQWKSWKVLLRCWVVSWLCFVIMLPDKSLATLGNTAFFGLLLSVMLPPNMPIQLFFLVITTVVVGVALGWALSCAAMAAALAARDQTLLKATLQKTQASAAGLANPDALFRDAIFNGDFLDPRSTVVFGVFFGFGCFAFALLRSYAPKLTFMSIFGTIALDIFCSFGPLFPFSQYTLLNSLLTSIGCYIAIALVFIILAFPETLNHSYLASSADLLEKLRGILAMQDDVLQADPHDLLPGTPLGTRVAAARAGALAQLQQLMGQKNMLNLEFSWGRWNGQDVEAMLQPMQIVATRLASLNSFGKLVTHSTLLTQTDDTESVTESTASLPSPIGDTYLLRQFREKNTAVEAEHGVRLVDVLPTIREATADVRSAALDVLVALKALFIAINTKRYRGGQVEQDARLVELDKALSALRAAMDAFKTDRRLELLAPYRSVFERFDAGALKNMPLRSLYLSFVFASNLTMVCHGIVGLAETVTATATKRARARLWFPTGLRNFGKFLRDGRGADQEAVGEDTQLEETVEAADTKIYKRDPDARPPKTPGQRVAYGIHGVFKWVKTPEFLFAFRMVIVSIGLWIPSVVRSSAHFAYAQRGVWAVIMAQTTLNIYASDQIYNYVARIGGTFVGALVGMVCWYIGAGHGNGNPYGLAASVAVFLFPLMFLRLYAPPQYLIGILLSAATFVLIVGYSWIDGNLPGIFQNLGVGWAVAWRRWVLVMIGCAASFIVMMLPPKSGRKAVRLRNASILSGLSYLYSHLTSLWLSAGEPFDAAHEKGGVARVWPQELRDKLVYIAEQLQDLRMRTAMSKWEGNVRGAWPFEDYNRMVDVQSDMLNSLILLAGALVNMDPDMRKATLPHTFVLNPHFISDVISTFFLVSQSLRTGEPLHEAQFKNLADRLHYHGSYAYVPSPSPSAADALAEANAQSTGAGASRSTLMHHTLRQALSEYEYMSYATAVVGVLQLTHNLNELRTIVADLVGEVPLEGFAEWRELHDRARVVV